MAEIDLGAKTLDEIETWISNHENRGVTNVSLYRALLEERAKRQSRGLNAEVSLRHLIQAAHAGHFTAYGDLAKANDLPWNVARHLMNGPNGHLDRLLDICHARNFPLLTAICVNQGGLENGALGADALKGFVSGAKRLGYTVTDELAFLREGQRQCFEWAKSQQPCSNCGTAV